MVERKKRITISQRDPAFTAKVETRNKHSSAFAIRTEEPDGPSTAPPAIADVAEKSAHETDSGPANLHHGTEPKPERVVGARDRQIAAKVDTAVTARKPAKAPTGPGKKEHLRVNFTVAADLVARAQKRAAEARCSPKRIALVALNEMKPQLIEGLAKLRHDQIDPERMEKAGVRISTTWAVDAALMARLAEELDPLGIGQVNSLVSYWVRDEFSEYFDHYLTKADC